MAKARLQHDEGEVVLGFRRRSQSRHFRGNLTGLPTTRTTEFCCHMRQRISRCACDLMLNVTWGWG